MIRVVQTKQIETKSYGPAIIDQCTKLKKENSFNPMDKEHFIRINFIKNHKSLEAKFQFDQSDQVLFRQQKEFHLLTPERVEQLIKTVFVSH